MHASKLCTSAQNLDDQEDIGYMKNAHEPQLIFVNACIISQK